MRSPVRRFHLLLLLAIVLAVPVALDAQSATPPRAIDDYRHFRILAIDLAGRMPTRDEISAFEHPGFNLDKWVEEQLSGPAYVERMTRIYKDVLRLEPNLNFSTGPGQLFRQEVQGPDGKPLYVYYRAGQRRARPETDGTFCLSPDETGLVVRPNGQAQGTAKKVAKATLDKYTAAVKPWWLYKDYKAASPSQRFGEGWVGPDPDYRPVEGLLFERDGTTPTESVRVCTEETQTAAMGHIFVRNHGAPASAPQAPAQGRKARAKDAPEAKPAAAPTKEMAKEMGDMKNAAMPPQARKPPQDRPYAVKHEGELVACDTRTGLDFAIDCGCGVGLERCVPNDSDRMGNAFYFPNHMPLGPGLPLDSAKQQAGRWYPYWWAREAEHFLDDLFASDRDFREILTGHATFVNGPLAQFYRTGQRGNCCGPAELQFGMTEETEPLFDPKNVPPELDPQDLGTWARVADRGPHAAGILTLPMFLEKYASARARGAVLYNAFLCKSFVADEQTQLTPSTESNLMVRPGCSTCHATLEPLAAYFARVEPGSFVFLPPATVPSLNAECRKDRNGKLPGRCNGLYDVAFSDDHAGMLRSAYGSPEHADATPAGAGEAVTRSPEFAKCAVQRVTSSFLGRPTTSDDAPLLSSLTDQFVKSGYRMKTLVRGIVRSPAYRKANNIAPGGAQ